MNDQPQPDQAIQAAPPAPQAMASAIQETPPVSDVIPLPPMPPTPEAGPPARVGWSTGDCIVLALVGVLAFFLGSGTATNSDLWMHLATGRALAEGSLALGEEPYSFATAADGTPALWVNHSWLYDVALYGTYSVFGEVGVVVTHAVLLLLLFLLIVKMRSVWLSPLAAVSIAALAVLTISVLVPVNSLVVTYLFFAALMFLMNRGGILASAGDDGPSTWALWSLPILFALWVNLDAWFILGLLTLLLGLLGTIISGFLGVMQQGALTPKVLASLAGVAACCVNPFHVHAFVLPPDLAYLLGSWLPSWLGAGGDAVRSLSSIPEFQRRYLGPFNPAILMNPNIVRAAYYVLLLVSTVSFVLVLLGRRAALAPPVHLGRLFIWIVAVLLGVVQYSMLPFFALIAGPVTILNLGDWARGRAPVTDELRILNRGLAQFAVISLTLIALALAWPGWLHSNQFSGSSSRRVAWRLQIDPSLHAAVVSLEKAQANRVFNMSTDVADYCAWFAPGVRCYLDRRLELFAKEASHYAKVKRELQRDPDDSRPRSVKVEWPDIFRRHQIDHLVLTNLIDLRQSLTWQIHSNASLMCLAQPEQWTLRYGDGRTHVFAWSPGAQAPARDLLAEWNREAFGEAPLERRAPTSNVDPPQSGLTLEELYVEGRPLLPPPFSTEPWLYQSYFALAGQRWQPVYFPTWQFGLAARRATLSGAAPGTILAVADYWASNSRLPIARSRDLGPPAAPILMIRQGRRSMAEPGFESLACQSLLTAYKLQIGLEETWASRDGETPPSGERAQVRQIQLATLLYSYLEMVPDDWKMRREYAQLLYGQHHLDAGLEQLMLAQASFEKLRSLNRDKKEKDAYKAIEKEIGEQVKRVDRDVKRRRTEWSLHTAKLGPQQKFEKACLEPYKTVNAENRDVIDRRGMGLTLEGFKELYKIKSEDLKAGERSLLHFNRFRLLVELGRLRDASEELVAMGAGKQPPNARLWHAAALGNYDWMQSALAQLDDIEQQRLPVEELRKLVAQLTMASTTTLHSVQHLPLIGRSAVLIWDNNRLMEMIGGYEQAMGRRAGWRTMRGLFALEVGDVPMAEEHFAEALRIAGPDLQFVDRPIAERYLELIRTQKKK